MNGLRRAQRITLCAVAAIAFTGAAAAVDHSHVQLSVEVRATDTSASGDALGVYAAQLVPCDVAAASRLPKDQSGSLHAFTERLLGVMVATAYANHRERFAGPAAGEFLKRVALDRADVSPIGEIVAPAARYCRVLLTLARLPAVGGTPELPFSLRLSMSAGREIKLDFRESLAVNLDKPWLANGRSATLVITLRPRSAAGADNFGAVRQRVVAQLAQAASAQITTR